MQSAVWRWVAVVSIAGAASIARAGDDSARAEELFRAGRQASARGDHKAACESYRESFRLENALGTLLNIAVCEEALGELASAWQHYQRVLLALAEDDPREALTRDRLRALEQRLPRITVQLSGGDRATTHIAIGAAEHEVASLREPLPIDPGEHELRVLAAGHEARSYRFIITESERRTLTVEPGAPIASHAATPAQSAPTLQAQPLSEVGDAGRDRRTFGWIALAIGGAGFVSSAVTFGLVLDRKATVDAHCPDRVCDDTGDAASRSGRVFSYVSLISLAGGAVATATGLYLLWTAPNERPPATATLLVDRNLLGAQVQGTF